MVKRFTLLLVLLATALTCFAPQSYLPHRRSHFRGAANPSATSLTNFVAYWKLDEASGTRADVSANAQDLTDNNTVTSATGVKGDAGSFASANAESLSRDDSATLSTGDIDFTFAVWFKATSLMDDADGGRSLFRKTNLGDTEREYTLTHLVSTAKLRFFISTTGADVKYVDSTETPSTNTWYFVVGSNTAATKTLSISVNNGTPATAVYTGTCRDGTGSFNVGRHPFPGNYWNGLIDELGFWKRTLTAAEVTFLYNSGAGRTYNTSTGRFE